ncbi:hypothetical protein M0R19_03175 [Candidatus Pacearchaeota archaeon]|jgi:hypothetical protein|nr:hypothetical protein [Candidatus Pacearchaeota archaeon]
MTTFEKIKCFKTEIISLLSLSIIIPALLYSFNYSFIEKETFFLFLFIGFCSFALSFYIVFVIRDLIHVKFGIKFFAKHSLKYYINNDVLDDVLSKCIEQTAFKFKVSTNQIEELLNGLQVRFVDHILNDQSLKINLMTEKPQFFKMIRREIYITVIANNNYHYDSLYKVLEGYIDIFR